MRLKIVFSIIACVIASIMMIGCDMQGGHYYVVHKPKPAVTYVEVTSPYETVVVQEVYVCDYPSYDPTPGIPYECVDYGITIGTCCSYTYSAGHWLCEEEWCWWEDMCYWDNTYAECFLD